MSSTSAEGGTGPPVAVRRFRSRPDLRPPVVTVSRQGPTAPGYIFLTPANGTGVNGPMIVDDTGELVWLRPDDGQLVTDLRLASYGGHPVLTWWQGTGLIGYGAGSYVIANRHYRQIAVVHAGHGYQGDLHEFLLTPRGTAFVTIFSTITGQVPTTRGLAQGPITEGVVQEIDVSSGRVLFEWHSAQHVPTTESYLALPKAPGEPYDYFHVNSVDQAGDGSLLVSARHTWTVYKIDPRTGNILWRLGGKRGDFRLGPGARFAWQHDARWRPDETISIFDDGAHGPPPQVETRSRGIVLELDERARTATLQRAYIHPDILAASQGSVQELADGHVFVGWGSVPAFTEFAAPGTILLDARFGGRGSYRAFRFPWSGRPIEPPAIAVEPAGDGQHRVFASWNGATDVASWQLLAGDAADGLDVIATQRRTGFETMIVTSSAMRLAAVRAVDAVGQVLGTSGSTPLA